MDAPTKTIDMAVPAKNAEPAMEQPVRSLCSALRPLFLPWPLGQKHVIATAIAATQNPNLNRNPIPFQLIAC